MSKINELIESIRGKYLYDYPDAEFSGHGIREIMKQYAEIYAKECLEKAAENAKCVYVHDFIHGFAANVKKESILNITLPKHK